MPDYPSEILNQIDELRTSNLPEHVAIIMDGNSRWARERGLELSRGHREGVHSVQAIADLCGEIEEIKVLTLYAFSTENWARPEDEIGTLMELLKEFLRKEVNRMIEQNVRFETIGDVEVLPDDVLEEVNRTKELTRENEEFILNLALNYGGRDEITRSIRKIGEQIENDELSSGDIDEELISDHLDTAHLVDPDLLIRTSGEQRISNFLLWQIAYSEIVITKTLWPDFREEEFLDALFEFQERERRYGRRPAYDESG